MDNLHQLASKAIYEKKQNSKTDVLAFCQKNGLIGKKDLLLQRCGENKEKSEVCPNQ